MITTDLAGRGQGVVVAARGSLTIAEAASLRDALLEAAGRCPAVTLDLSGVEEMDLACMQVLLAARTELAGCGGTLCMTGLAGRLARSVEDAGLSRLYDAVCG